MGQLESRCLDAFPAWLKTLPEDVRTLAALLDGSGLNEAARRRVTTGLNYLFKSLDLIPDGIEDLGFVDDLFVLRVAASAAAQADEGGAAQDKSGTLARLAADTGLIREFLGEAYPRLETYVQGLENVAARGRSVDQIIQDPAVLSELVREIAAWADSYDIPTFARDEKNLVKLRSFLNKRLP
jgi:uncharacterized membrane protein YkvA (DUF1232 family)